MDDWFSTLAAGSELPPDAARELREHGFVVLPGPVPAGEMDRLARAYDTAAASAAGDDVRVGSTTTRVTDFVNRGAEFDGIYVFPPLLEACCRIIGRPFMLSSMHARTLRPGSPAQELHVDVRRGSADWPLAGFILMVDEFRPDNGATRFVPGSHRWSAAPDDVIPDPGADYDGQVLACGPAGSLLVFDGSAWHGHTGNTSDGPRRSLQGAFIPRGGRAGTDFAARMRPDTRARLGPLARHVLQL
ncbi:phytanoyl-CoA dioxygenase family protein [Longimicrobium sp.]|uniref:phytanoyl-CoA dioxygenase family protein n=1 Tax=Longimicrobium sp. TaxID=2029185 RepID=UPI002B8EBDEB|nr:phytanoyl-CoA dioxygenase family protein [Longimicrobium sp.]HSU14105.1 phytanoyl-CoA dioxygenase family protein [Longimicrobium sp.]